MLLFLLQHLLDKAVKSLHRYLFLVTCQQVLGNDPFNLDTSIITMAGGLFHYFQGTQV